MRVLIAPDCFGDSLTAVEAARAIADGWRRARPADEVVLAPQSDGGPGFVDVLAARSPGLRVHLSRVSGPLDAPVDARWGLDPATATAYIESAQACGLALLDGPPNPATALAAHSRGVGELIADALGHGARTIVVGLGGSCCTDGGRGMVEALGGTTGGSARAAADRLAGITLIAATDVDHPLLGPAGAARVFGPQKGADPPTVELLEQRMTAWIDVLEAETGRPVRALPGAGAAGGLGAALLAMGGRRLSGAAVIAAQTGLADDIAVADLIITGEGRLDGQSLHGKVVGTLATRAADAAGAARAADAARAARAAAVPVLVLAGQVALDGPALTAAGVDAAYSVAEHAGSLRRSIDDAAGQLSSLAELTARRLARE